MHAILKRILPVLACGVACAVTPTTHAASPRNLMIQVRIDSDNSRSGQGASVGIGDAAARGRVYQSRRSGGNSSIQQVAVIEGGQAFINVGQSVAVPMHRILVSPVGAVISDSVLIRDLGAGFYVKPTLKGDGVVLEINAYQDTQDGTYSSPLDVNTTRISTTISGKPGEWMRLGGSSRQQGDNRDIGGYSTRAGTSDRQIWLRVDAGP